MAIKWCRKCEKEIDSEKTTYWPGLLFAISALFYVLVPFLGTIIGLPFLIITCIWYLMTKSVCPNCGGSDLTKLKDKPSEYQRISEKYNEK